MMGSFAEFEARQCSARIKAALAAAKRRGVKLGGDNGNVPTNKVRALAVKSIKDKADARAADIAPTICALQANGATSLRQIAKGLNAQGISTPRGKQWDAPQVQRVLLRLA
jgi:DNA invertase Pin-like site-specific DNA recombinase